MSPQVPDELRTLELLSPWVATQSDFASELARETGLGHPLYGREAVAVARRLDQDDVLFWLPAGPTLLAVVHLTYSGQRERASEWPAVQLYHTVTDWVERGMRADHAETERRTE